MRFTGLRQSGSRRGAGAPARSALTPSTRHGDDAPTGSERTAAANAFLESLTPELRKEASFPARTRRSAPTGTSFRAARVGVSLLKLRRLADVNC